MRYDDIIDRPYIKSKRHKWMSMHDRAGQFSPFAALVGYDEKVKEKGRYVEKKVELDEEAYDILDRKLQYIDINKGIEYVITYFKKDMVKSGGQYITVTSKVKKIDDLSKRLILANDEVIYIEDIYDIDSYMVDLTII